MRAIVLEKFGGGGQRRGLGVNRRGKCLRVDAPNPSGYKARDLSILSRNA